MTEPVRIERLARNVITAFREMNQCPPGDPAAGEMTVIAYQALDELEKELDRANG